MKTRILTILALSAALATAVQAATIPVISTADSGAGTLRAALANAANSDTIDATGVSGTILLTTGELVVSNSVSILGPGPGNLKVDGNAASRVFHITNGVTVAVSKLTITNGLVSGVGGGIWNDRSTLTVSNCTVTANSAASRGGGIYNDGASGGAILTVIASTLRGNSGLNGGGLGNAGDFGSAYVTVTDSTLSSNSASGFGGGIFNGSSGGFSQASLTVSNSTISGNSASDGGGIFNGQEVGGLANALVIASTLSGNTASSTADGIYNTLAGLEIGNTILNVGAGGSIANFGGTVTSDGYNLSSDGGGGFLTGTADQINTNPNLGPLQNNGGPTFTHALLAGSPAIDKGKSFGLTTDQRGQPRPYDDPNIANATGGDGTDIGAFEVQPLAFQITSIAREGSNIRVVWDTTGGATDVVQATAGTTGGSYSNNFTTISPLIIVSGSGQASTNFTESGGATNVPARYYRIKRFATLAADNASDPGYSGGWTNGSNGGIGFSPWKLTASGVIGSSTNGYFIGSSTNNAGTSLPGIDVGGKSWGIYANSGNLTAAYRSFANGSLLVGQSLLINMDNGYIDSNQTVGVVLRNGNASSAFSDYNVGARFEFLYIGDDSSNSYKVVDSGFSNIGTGFTGTGKRLVFTLTGANTYTLLTIDNASGTTNTFSGTLAGSGTVDSIALFNRNAGNNADHDTFFNSLQIIGP